MDDGKRTQSVSPACLSSPPSRRAVWEGWGAREYVCVCICVCVCVCEREKEVQVPVGWQSAVYRTVTTHNPPCNGDKSSAPQSSCTAGRTGRPPHLFGATPAASRKMVGDGEGCSGRPSRCMADACVSCGVLLCLPWGAPGESTGWMVSSGSEYRELTRHRYAALLCSALLCSALLCFAFAWCAAAVRSLLCLLCLGFAPDVTDMLETARPPVDNSICTPPSFALGQWGSLQRPSLASQRVHGPKGQGHSTCARAASLRRASGCHHFASDQTWSRECAWTGGRRREALASRREGARQSYRQIGKFRSCRSTAVS
ncbi:hypothetical protein K431DRAFT_29123 [Polychaeton citri CBS 116435]|uniref:Uncharacterized protein n=1 Tax=Polychaeton citri CBS 116435 TaxID=1314669 RepID=A0A9P4USR9_9PEZI|nr:hypothetical protein K431DRAFT_29123 [Polychaeton citri CBS 116435]